MNILLINHYAGSPQHGMEFRPYYLAKEWIKKGHKVLIVAASFSHLRKKNIELSDEYSTEQISGIDYLWIKTPEYFSNGLSRFKNMLTFVRKLNKRAKKIASDFKPDAVIASSTYPMDIVPAKKIAKLSNAKLVFEIHDLWPLSPQEIGGYSKFHPFIMFIQHFENKAYKKSDKVISILPKTLEHTKKHGLSEEKWTHIPNGIFMDDWNNSIEIPVTYTELFKELKQNGKKIIGYAGGHALSNSLDSFVEAAIALKDNNKYIFVLVGDGVEKENLKKKADNITNIKFLDSVNKKSIPDLLSYFDILYIGWNRSPLYRFGISPNKVFDYMMSEKPIIHAVEAGNDMVKDANAGLSIEPENPEKLVDAIKKLSTKSDNELKQMGMNGKKYVLENHEYSVLADKFLDVLKG